MSCVYLVLCREEEKESNPKALIDALKFYDGYKDHSQNHVISDGKFISYAEEESSSEDTGMSTVLIHSMF